MPRLRTIKIKRTVFAPCPKCELLYNLARDPVCPLCRLHETEMVDAQRFAVDVERKVREVMAVYAPFVQKEEALRRAGKRSELKLLRAVPEYKAARENFNRFFELLGPAARLAHQLEYS